MTQKFEYLQYDIMNTNSPRTLFTATPDNPSYDIAHENSRSLYGLNDGALVHASHPQFTNASAFNITHNGAYPAEVANDSQGAPEDSSEHFRRSALWSLPDSAVVRTAEAALMLTRSVRTMQNWRYRRVGPSYQLGSTVTYKVGDLRAYVDGCTTTARKLPKYG